MTGGGLVGAETIIMATSNPASISRFAEIGRQDILREAHRERLALEAVKGRSRESEVDDLEGIAVPALGVRAVVLGWLGRRAAVVGRT